MVSKLTALFLALIIGNPVCCCAMADLLAGDVETAPRIQTGCCQAMEEGDQEETPERPDSCPCLLDQEHALASTHSFFIKAAGDDSVAESFVHTDCSRLLPHLSPVVSHVSKWPPGSLPVDSLSQRLAFQGCYLL